MFAPIKKQILSVFSISIIVLVLLYSAVASAVKFNKEVSLKGFENKPGWVFRNVGTRALKIQIPEPAVVDTDAPLPIVTVMITYPDERAEHVQVTPGETFVFPAGATAQVIVADAVSDEVVALWGDVEFDLTRRGIDNLLPEPRTLADHFPRTGRSSDNLTLELLEQGREAAMSQEEALLQQLRQIQRDKEAAAQKEYRAAVSEALLRRDQALQELEQAMETAKQEAQASYDSQIQAAALREKELMGQEAEVARMQAQEPAMKECLEKFFRVCEQLDGVKKQWAMEMRDICRTMVVASAELKQVREELAKAKKAREQVESARAAAALLVERDSDTAKLRVEREAAAARDLAEREHTAAIERIRKIAIPVRGEAPQAAAAAAPIGSPPATPRRASGEAPQANPGSPTKKEKPPTPPTPRGSMVGKIFGTVVDKFTVAPLPRNDTEKSGDGDSSGSGAIGALAAAPGYSSM